MPNPKPIPDVQYHYQTGERVIVDERVAELVDVFHDETVYVLFLDGHTPRDGLLPVDQIRPPCGSAAL